MIEYPQSEHFFLNFEQKQRNCEVNEITTNGTSLEGKTKKNELIWGSAVANTQRVWCREEASSLTTTKNVWFLHVFTGLITLTSDKAGLQAASAGGESDAICYDCSQSYCEGSLYPLSL
jgi:hypothetical protein